MYKEEDFLQLSGIQHFAFCRRQWALAYIELQWQENVRTVEGKILHENAHDVNMKEKRGDLLIVRAMPIHSWEMGVSGECDVVEFHKVKDGIQLAGKEGLYKAVPVEYKRGRPKTDDFGYSSGSGTGNVSGRNVMLRYILWLYLLWRNQASHESRIYRRSTGKGSEDIFGDA